MSMTFQLVAQTVTVTGKVLEKKSLSPVEYAAVWVKSAGVGAVTDRQGHFRIQNLPIGENVLSVSCLGYMSREVKIEVRQGMKSLMIYLPEQNLALDEVTVTAHRKTDEATTTYTIGRTVLDHLQAVSVADAMSLLPGEQTNTTSKLTDGGGHVITLRGASTEMGSPDFGTVIEMDGVRLSGSGQLVTGGTDTRNIGSNNIESIEVITGVPSVEYGDLTNGMVKIKTFKGKTPVLVEAAVRPNTQIYSVSKGFDLGSRNGVLNLSYERARSVSDLASPYTSYVRNAMTLKYSNTFLTFQKKQLDLDFNVSGNVGGYNSESDPDAFKETYRKIRDNAFRSSLSMNYRVNSPWLTNLDAGLSFSYADQQDEQKINQSASSSQPAIHVTEEGYFVGEKYEDNPDAPIVLLPVGYWYSTAYDDSKPLNYSAYLKARWSHRFKQVSSNLLIGGELKGDGNLGQGAYYDDLRTAPTWREYRYDDLPFTHNLSLYAEEELGVAFPSSHLKVKAGIRSDMTFIKGSEYGRVSSLSPRFNMSYSFAENPDGFVKGITVRAGWGKAVKLPSFEILYPRTSYSDRLSFAPGTMADGTSYYAYHTLPRQLVYNQNLKWQYNIMRELGLEARLKGVRIALSFFYNTMYRPYEAVTSYSPFDYKFTGQTALEDCLIPSENREYSMDRQTGIVTVIDKSGTYPSQQLAYKVMNDMYATSTSVNGSSSRRIGLEWVLDFDKIPSLNTSFRIDGKYYQYRGVDELISQSSSSIRMNDGQPYQYVGYYVGGANSYNGMETKQLNTNLTVMTHIPKIRMIFSLKIEGTFLNTQQRLSEYSGGERSFVLESRDSSLPAADGGSIYAGDNYIGTYPLYYASRDDLNTRIPFRDKFLWAYENDRQLYNDLSKLVMRSNTGYTFKEWKYSPYFSANINVTKEIGDHLTVAFYANNFFNSMQKIKAWHTGTEQSLFASGRIPAFSYGISLKVKL